MPARNFLKLFSVIAILSVFFSSIQPPLVRAQGGDGLQRQVNAESGRVSFIRPASGKSLSASRALGTFARLQDPAMALAKRYGPEFGLEDPQNELAATKKEQGEGGRLTVRYQQEYQEIPVMGGELIVNTNENGDLYSISGEVSPGLNLSTQPAISPAQAQETALQSLAKWYQKNPKDFTTTEPELWIFDESLLQPSTRPVELTWRMEVTAKDNSLPVRELVLVNAQNGGISLHFNQIDTAWTTQKNADGISSPTLESPQPTEALLPPAPADVLAAPGTKVFEIQTESDSSVLYSSSPQADATGNIWYVSTAGSDGNNCSTPATPCATINAAIGKATAGDTIEVAIGIYTSAAGEEVVLVNKGITLSGGWDTSFTAQNGFSTIDGGGARRGITVMGGAIAIIEQFKVQNGLACSGGGIYIYGGSNTLTLNKSIVTSNKGSCREGGGIGTDGTTTINDSAITNNSSGGIRNSSGTLVLNNSLVSGNYGGNGISVNSSTTLNNSTVSGNLADVNGGGGIYVDIGKILVLNNSTIIRNGTYNEGAGGGLLNNGSVTMRNTILALNTTTSGSGPDCTGGIFGTDTITSKGYNLIGNNSGCTFTPTTGDIVGTSANPINPLLIPLRDNGGPTLTHALMQGSPAVNAGNPAMPGSGVDACLATDQRGITRPVGARCDIGAYEGAVPVIAPPLVETYTAKSTPALPGLFLCDQTQQPCTSNNADPQADAVHANALGTYNLYSAKYGRNSIDNKGMRIVSTVHYCVYVSGLCPYDNAFWNGEQMVYGDAHGYALADDVVAHELTHGVTQYESNLLYTYQSGAINESLSDLWGEYYDQTNGLGNDDADVKWRIGEDISGWTNPVPQPSLGLRDMADPTLFLDPDKMSSLNYFKGEEDNGGVHHNSGVNNKAVSLLVDGGTFNGKTVTALGWEEVGSIYYEAQTHLLSSGANYSDLYYALQQACTDLIGQGGITVGDCVEVKNALDAVEMNTPPVTTFADVPVEHMFWKYIEAFYDAGLTTGCSQSPKMYCPNANVTRAEMATFIERALGNFNPSPNPTGMFADVPYPGLQHLTPFIEQFYNDGLTTGCAGSPLRYCPNANVTRAEMATFIERALGNFNPTPNPTGMFADVPAPGLEHLTPFIEQFYNDGITTGCARDPLKYCPQNLVTRQEMAVFIVRAFHIPLP